jgi:hypothetical protein
MRRIIPLKNHPHEFSDDAAWTIRAMAMTTATKRRTHAERGMALKIDISYP